MALNEWFIQGKIEIDFYMGSIVKFVSPFKDFPKMGRQFFWKKDKLVVVVMVGSVRGGVCPKDALFPVSVF